ncbi:RxLR effector protein [Phytophthora megakarya]|uniref:RxLR effector protein n=1 Tax=Phytophthora megakarya TaxID=4795 RepID=A0A225V7J1_9STRA|nr:RxLR effector protein [Phytophthora megakarya]
MVLYLYENECSSSDSQDAALLCLLWYLFGRAADLSLVRKQNLSIDAAETSKEQGLSLFPDADFVTCPLHAIAMALITQAAPSTALVDDLSEGPVAAAVNLSPATPLLNVLNHPDEFASFEAAATSVTAARAPVDTTPTIYTHVNRMLDRVASAAGVADTLTSHSFRRGGAQHVNVCDGLTQRWIFD